MTEVRTAGPVLVGAACTDPGRVRTNNEDLPLIDAARGIFGVIDGIGGHAGGEVAAAMARDVILQRLARPLGTPAERVREAIAIANNEIFRRAEELPELRGMACVITLAVVADGRLTIGHVGDSRFYKLRTDGFQKLTRDHSPVGEREDAGEIGEVDAMRHPKRHEVFRDVGSAYRDKDEQEFVDVIEAPLERDSAILLCSDGLTDMVSSAAIERVIRQHAGDPEHVVRALVAAANDAGGKDNVTVVYAEGPDFVRAISRSVPAILPPTAPPHSSGSAAAPRESAPAPEPRSRDRVRRLARAVVGSRTTWFGLGALIGVLSVVALLMAWRVSNTPAPTPRTIAVAADGTAGFTRIADAMAAARSGDVVRVEPGVYRERVVVRDGVDLVARVPGTVTIGRAAGTAQTAPGLTVFGFLPTRVSGIRIESAPEQPMDVGVRISGPAVTLELMEIAGPMRAAIALVPAGSVTIRGGRFAVSGTVISVPDDGHAALVNNIITRAGTGADPPVSIGASAQVSLRGNVFVGYGAEIITGISAARRQQLLTDNIVVVPDARSRPRQ